jgi:hypothetical protein
MNPERIRHIQCLPHHRLDQLFGAGVGAHPVGLPGDEAVAPRDRLVELEAVGWWQVTIWPGSAVVFWARWPSSDMAPLLR